jgi:hypothetical protein
VLATVPGNAAVGPQQRSRHNRAVALLGSVTSARALVGAIAHLRVSLKWKYSTTLTFAASFLGSLRSPFVALSPERRQQLVLFTKGAVWSSFLKEISRNVIAEDVNFPRAITSGEIAALLRQSCRADVRACIILAWSLCGRVADILRLRSAKVRVSNGTLLAQFVEGKGVSMSQQPFSIATALGPHAKEMATYVALAQEHTFLFPQPIVTKRELKLLLNATPARRGKRLELRSFRRGGLQALATAGVANETMLAFSRHTDVKRLHRYLNWGWFGMRQHMTTVEAGSRLWSSPSTCGGGKGQLLSTTSSLPTAI